MTELDELLEARGFEGRESQRRLFDHLNEATMSRGVIAQAGTGTGKSLGVLASAARHARLTGEQSIVITPTLTLMNQYRDGDTPYARKAFPDIPFAEIRGMSHYNCEQSAQVCSSLGEAYPGGCLGKDGLCSQKGWEGHDKWCPEGCEHLHGPEWECGYREARYDARRALVVVTNADMLIVNDTILAGLGVNFLQPGGLLLVDEAHTLEAKLRDYASRSLHWSRLERFKYAEHHGQVLGKWLQREHSGSLDLSRIPMESLRAVAQSSVPESTPGASTKQQAETQEGAARILRFIEEPHTSAVLHVNDQALRMDWINVARSAGELLSTRSFGLVSATIPKTMAAALGVPNARFVDVGHPFDYANQAWIGFSPYGGSHRDAQIGGNFDLRVAEVRSLIERSKGGALILFSSFRDLEAVRDVLEGDLRRSGLLVLSQERDMESGDRQALADAFKRDGNAVLFGSESFATGFDAPGDALRLLVLWKLPYPAVDPVSNAIRADSFPKYEDMMTVRAVQAIGRMIRTSTDRGIAWVADSRGRRLLNANDPLTAHLTEFARLP